MGDCKFASAAASPQHNAACLSCLLRIRGRESGIPFRWIAQKTKQPCRHLPARLQQCAYFRQSVRAGGGTGTRARLWTRVTSGRTATSQEQSRYGENQEDLLHDAKPPMYLNSYSTAVRWSAFSGENYNPLRSVDAWLGLSKIRSQFNGALRKAPANPQTDLPGHRDRIH